MDQNNAFLSILTTDDYLPGLLVLNSSLREVESQYPLHVLLTPDISQNVIDVLDKNCISHSTISQKINNPTDIDLHHRWFLTYSKLAMFDQIQYTKIVYIDADMLVLRNIDELFERPHMSATNDGGMLPRKNELRHQKLNSGLIVIEPSHKLFDDMMGKVGMIENLNTTKGSLVPIHGSDQDFINAYYPKWPSQEVLHLDHKYNIFHYHLDEFNKIFGYGIKTSLRPISVIHYASYLKPWNINVEEIKVLENNPNKKLELEAIRLWIKKFNNLI